MIPLLQRAHDHRGRIALIDEDHTLTYDQLIARSSGLAYTLMDGKDDLREQRVAMFLPPSTDYVIAQWAIWLAGGIAVPLCIDHPVEALKYALADSQCSMLIARMEDRLFLGGFIDTDHVSLIHMEEAPQRKSSFQLSDIALERKAMILYTSGTTNLPKGVVHTHSSLSSQIEVLVNAWHWEKSDHILNVLPLHHVHGIINVMSCALWSGGICQFLPRFDADKVWNHFADGKINIFMAVPTIYYKLIAAYANASSAQKTTWSDAARQFRLMVSGSAALPVSVLKKWKEITGQVLLERYGMTEIGMGLSNPYEGERRPGHVGHPLPGVAIRTVDEQYNEIQSSSAGELLIKGPSLFQEYWNNPEATQKAFTVDGWFKTGDVGIVENGYYRLLGRTSVDIIKSGGYKISALEIEEVVRRHDGVTDCAVVGLESEEWGQVIACALISDQTQLDFDDMKEWLTKYLPKYKVPRQFKIVEELPKNTIGKVTKKDVITLFQ